MKIMMIMTILMIMVIMMVYRGSATKAGAVPAQRDVLRGLTLPPTQKCEYKTKMLKLIMIILVMTRRTILIMMTSYTKSGIKAQTRKQVTYRHNVMCSAEYPGQSTPHPQPSTHTQCQSSRPELIPHAKPQARSS